ncbi:hypothetical protein [Streptomyces sp. NPDC012888]|uniref:hypothetical protein n=1 Tax=Streptomyces sp. NPDC012888 TaxID=3364855 RepID=UPI0036CB7E85
MTTPHRSEGRPFLSLHTPVVLICAVLAGATAGGLTFLGGTGAALSVLAGLTAAAVAVPALRALIG